MTLPPERLKAALAEHYTIERELGHGGMATVYLARDLRHDRRVALKVLLPELADAVGPDRFLREITLTARLEHPGILPLLDSGNADGCLFYTMPFVEGESLRDRLDREKQLPIADALQIAREVGDALGYAHARGIVHRDIKPGNILLSGRHARVADFGIARAAVAAGGETLTEAGVAIGTLLYMSPEQAAGGEEVDGRSDIYSLGCVLYEMLAGEPPYTASSPQVLLAHKSLNTVRPIRPIRPAVPEDVERAMLTALEPVPADRFATAEDFVERLEAPGRAHVKPDRRRSRRRFVAVLGAGLVALFATIGIAWQASSEDGPNVVEILPNRIAVFPFLAEDPELAYLREGLMDMVSHAIDGAGEIRRVDPFALMNELSNTSDAEAPSLRTASRVAKDLGAGRFLLGRVVPSGQSVQILTSLYITSANGTELEHQFRHEGYLDSLAGVAAALARDVLLRVPTGPGTWVAEDNADVGHAALVEYLRGEALMRRSQQNRAAAAFEKAIAADSTFALAWLRLAFAEDFRLNDRRMVEAIRQATAFVDRLHPRDRMLAEVLYANYHGDGPGSERAAQLLVGRYPSYAEGWYQLATSQLWYGWQRGRSPLHARPALERALALDPDHRQALYRKAWLAELDGNFAHAESLQTRVWGAPWSLPPADTSKFPTFLVRADSFHIARLVNLVFSTAGRTDRLQDASRIGQILTNNDKHPPDILSVGHLLAGKVEAAAGRWDAASEAFQKANAAAGGVGVLESGWLAALPFMRVAEETRRTLRDSIAGWTPPSHYLSRPRTRDAFQFPFPGLLLIPPWMVPHVRHYVLGLLSAGLGDEREALRYASLVRRASAPSDSIGLLRDFALEIRALIALQRGDSSVALGILDSAGLQVASHYQVYESMFHTRPLTRLLRAEALASLGREREALGWYAPLPWYDPTFPCLAWNSFRQGELRERLGEPAIAADHYRRFVARWGNADSVHQPLVRDVRKRLDRLHGKRFLSSRAH